MLTNAKARRALAPLGAISLAAVAQAFTVLLSFSTTGHGAAGVPTDDDLNLLLRLLSQNIRIGLVEIARPIDPLWIKDIRKLQSSRNPAVAKTARAVEDSVKGREDALKLLETTEAKNEQLRQEMKEKSARITDEFGGLFGGVSDSDVYAARDSGQITGSEAEAYLMSNAGKERALLELGGIGVKIYSNSYLADKTVRAMRKKLEVLEADALAEYLAPALAARAGAKKENPPVRIAAGMAGIQHDICVLPSILSTANEPLTHLTLLMEIRTRVGRRRAVAFIPKLEPGRGVQVAPVPYDSFIVSRPNDQNPSDTNRSDKANVIRYSVWCDQFTYEGEEVPVTPSKDAKIAYCSLAGEKGRSYDLDERRFESNRTTYRLQFTELTPDQNIYRVKGNLSLFDPRNRDKPLSVTTFDGTFRSVDPAPPPAAKTRKGPPMPDPARKNPSIFDQARKGMSSPPQTPAKEPSSPANERRSPAFPRQPADALLTITSGSEQSEIDLYIGENGEISWSPASGVLQDRMVRTTEQIISVRAAARAMLDARELAMAGNKDEAVRVLKDYMATNPGEQRVAHAEQTLKRLDSLAEHGAQIQAFKDASGISPEMVEARKLAIAGKKEEAATVLKDYIATKPGEKQVAQAQNLLKQLDSLAAQSARFQEFKDARTKAAKGAAGDGQTGVPGSAGGIRGPGSGVGGLGGPKGMSPGMRRSGITPDPSTPNRP
jgi:hypothetical protein